MITGGRCGDMGKRSRQKPDRLDMSTYQDGAANRLRITKFNPNSEKVGRAISGKDAKRLGNRSASRGKSPRTPREPQGIVTPPTAFKDTVKGKRAKTRLKDKNQRKVARAI